MRPSYLIAGFLAVAAFGWILSGQLDGERKPARAVAADAAAATGATAEVPLAAVRVRRITPGMRVRRIIVNGRTEASRMARLRAQTEGRIVAILVEEGQRVRKGAVIARIDVQDREARLTEYQALLKQREIEYQAAVSLSRKGFRSSTSLAQARTLLDSAKANIKTMRIDLSHTVLRAPFDGVLEQREAELGNFLKIGDTVARIVDLDPVLVVGAISERDIAQVRLGGAGSAVLIDGRIVTGKVRYVASVADAATRTFRVELEVANPDGLVRDGLTAELRLPLPPVRAHKISPALLTLAEDGRIGVKLIDANSRVVFAPVTIVGDTADGVWLGGLPDNATIITVGHEYVKAGQKVRAVPETVESTS
jgi:membrane fusion protein, multidrug efflux system